MLTIAQGNETLSSVSGILLAGGLLRCCRSLERLDTLRLRETQRGRVGNQTVVRTSVLLSALGLNDYSDVEAFHADPVFLEAAGGRLPSQETFRQRIDQLGECAEAFRLLDDANVELLQGLDYGRVQAGRIRLVPVDIDVSVMAEPCSFRKEGVGWTYKKENGYAPIFAYLGTRGFALASELRPGAQHSAKGAVEFAERCLRLTDRLGLKRGELLFRLDSGHDDSAFLAALRDAGVHFLVKRNLRRESREELIACVVGSGRMPGVAHGRLFLQTALEVPETRTRLGLEGVRHVAEHVIRCIGRDGQPLLIPEEELNCWWTTLPCNARTCVRLYHEHATSEQCHAELKDDMGMERMPSGKMASNALVLHCAMLAFNCLRRIGRLALEHGRRRPAAGDARRRARGRMRARTVIDTFLRVAGHVVRHAGKGLLKLGRTFAAFPSFLWLHRQCCLQ